MPTWYDEPLEARARTHERVQAILFVLRFGLMFALASIFWLSGWATALAEGLRSRFLMPYTWPLVHVLFVALAVFGYEAILFPLSVLADHFPERSHDHPQGAFGQWLRGYLTSLVLEIALVTAVFAGLYVLMRYFDVLVAAGNGDLCRSGGWAGGMGAVPIAPAGPSARRGQRCAP